MQHWQAIVAVIGDVSETMSAAVAVIVFILSRHGGGTPPGDGPAR